MSFEEDDLESGLKIIGEVNPSSRSCAIGFFVRTGSRDENPGESGLSHFLEHMVFKGSETRDSTKVNKELDLIGASSNAFTSEENTVYYGSVLPEYLPRMIDLFGDILRPALREADFAMEKRLSSKKLRCTRTSLGGKSLKRPNPIFSVLTRFPIRFWGPRSRYPRSKPPECANIWTGDMLPEM